MFHHVLVMLLGTQLLCRGIGSSTLFSSYNYTLGNIIMVVPGVHDCTYILIMVCGLVNWKGYSSCYGYFVFFELCVQCMIVCMMPSINFHVFKHGHVLTLPFYYHRSRM